MTLPDVVIDCPYYLLTRASLVMTAHLKQAFAAAGAGRIRPAYVGALMCLWREDGQKGVELGRCAGLEPSTMTGLLDRMERDGLVERRPDPGDRRAQRIFLTAEGRRAEAAVSEIVDRTMEETLRDVPEKELRKLKTTLRQILTNANKLGG